MSKIRLFILLVCCAVFGTALCAVISEKQAGDIAAHFLAPRSMNATGLNIAHRAPLLGSEAPSGRNAYYVFNLAQAGQGFVIVAGDDRVPAILGYSDQGAFDAADVPPVLQEWLDGYNSQIKDYEHQLNGYTKETAYGKKHFFGTAEISQMFESATPELLRKIAGVIAEHGYKDVKEWMQKSPWYREFELGREEERKLQREREWER